jgi:hypothetical protein
MESLLTVEEGGEKKRKKKGPKINERKRQKGNKEKERI